VRAKARQAEQELPLPDLFTDRGQPAEEAAVWAVDHLAERQAVFAHGDLLAAALAREPGTVTAEAAERVISSLEEGGSLHAATGLGHGRHWTTDAALARESETIALMQAGQGSGKAIMRGWIASTKLHRGRLNEGQKAAVKMILNLPEAYSPEMFICIGHKAEAAQPGMRAWKKISWRDLTHWERFNSD